jgi:myo-inositol-1-phosphate synthase
MQTQQSAAVSTNKFVVVGAAAVLVAGLALFNGSPRAASAFDATVAAASTAAVPLMHDGVDWGQVAATPVSTGATVGAYN